MIAPHFVVSSAMNAAKSCGEPAFGSAPSRPRFEFIAGDFKPKPRVYLSAAEALNIKPNECMMTAAHSNDLKSAAENGLRTAHVGRPGENGPGTGESAPRVPVDVAATSFTELADKLGA